MELSPELATMRRCETCPRSRGSLLICHSSFLRQPPLHELSIAVRVKKPGRHRGGTVPTGNDHIIRWRLLCPNGQPQADDGAGNASDRTNRAYELILPIGPVGRRHAEHGHAEERHSDYRTNTCAKGYKIILKAPINAPFILPANLTHCAKGATSGSSS